MINFRSKNQQQFLYFITMKTKFITAIIALFAAISFGFYNPFTNQTVTGVYQGEEDFNYQFSVTQNGKSSTMTFHYVNDEVLDKYDLDTEDFIGETFAITFEKSIEVYEDEDGNEEETEVLTILDLKLKE